MSVLLPEERAFPRFAHGVLRDLYKAALADVDVFLLGLAGGLLGAPSRRWRGLGQALGTFVILRRLDTYVDVGVQIARAAHLSRQAQFQPPYD